jgi:inhibitor of cysteine peptidase
MEIRGAGRSCLILALVMLAALVGCGATNGEDTGNRSREVSLGAKDHGGQVDLAVGQTLVLTLESNPTTGYRWEVVEAEQSVLQQKGEVEFKVDSDLDPPPPGTGGVEIFRYAAVGAGETRLELGYHRPWEEGVEPLETFSIEVAVR